MSAIGGGVHKEAAGEGAAVPIGEDAQGRSTRQSPPSAPGIRGAPTPGAEEHHAPAPRERLHHQETMQRNRQADVEPILQALQSILQPDARRQRGKRGQ